MKAEPQDDIAARLARLSPEQRALFELRLKKHRSTDLLEKSRSRRAAGQPAPLSFAQQRIWFLNQLAPESNGYNQPKAVRLHGNLDLQALQKTLDAVVERHEILRTVIRTVDGDAVQVIRDPQRVKLPLIDVSDWPEPERDTEAQRLLHELTHLAFDLGQDLMLRATVIRLSKEEHILLLVIHHIASDGWSRGILWREITELYGAFVSGRASTLVDLPLQYADYAIWQKQWLQGDVLATQLSYWKKKLADIPALNLPTDRARPAIQSYQGKTEFLALSQELSEKLKALSRHERVTLFMTLLAAFEILLHRYTGQKDIVVGSPIANRSQLEIEGLIGFFVNTLVLRVEFSGEPRFRDFLASVKEMALEAYAHQELPFEKLVEELNPERDLSRQPLFQTMFQLRNDPNESLELQGINIKPLEFDSGIAKFDLSLSMIEDETGRLSGALEYNSDLFEHATIERMLGHFHELLKGIVADPEQRITDIPILVKSEQHQLLVGWNSSEKHYPRAKCIHELFEEQVKRTPDSVAVVFADRQLTYRELNRQANRIARHFRKLGVGAEMLAGVCMERSLDLVVTLLAVLKAGAAYVPLDPSYPKDRLAFMLGDARVRVLLTQKRLLENLPEYSGRVVCMDEDLPQFALHSGEDLNTEVTPEQLAYVIYTSGSTGKPKAAMIPHGAIANHMLWMQEVFPLSEKDRVLQKTSSSFDAAVWEFYAPLLAGAVLVMAPDDRSDVATWVKLVAERQITVLQVVPSVLQVLLEDGGVERWRSLRRLYCGGELLPLPLAKRLSALLPNLELYNLYGPTEATIDALCGVWNPKSDKYVVPIGRPISNVQAYVLDPRLKPIPIGVAGELYLGGAGLARGYLNRPELTSERFVPNPFSNEPGARLYRTGDLCRYLPDGNLEFLGRVDHQVKIRGFRIEPGEIESVLSQHASVREAVVLAREDNPGDKRLVAYVVAKEGPASSANDLRALVKAKLPEYMVPSAFVFLETLPLTSNGKLDRDGLPAPDRRRTESGPCFVAPRGAVEELLAAIWAEVLKLEKVGVHENFFDLGGHSLKATQVIARVREAFRMDLPLRVLFEAPTLAELAARVEQSLSDGGDLEELARSLAEVEALSEEDIERQLENEKT